MSQHHHILNQITPDRHVVIAGPTASGKTAAALALAAPLGLVLEPMTTTYFVARSSVVDGPGKMPAWRCGLFAWMMRQSEGAATYFKLPANQVVELGTQVML